MVLVSDAVVQHGHKGCPAVLLVEAKIGVFGVRQLQVDRERAGQSHQGSSWFLLGACSRGGSGTRSDER